MNRNSLDSNITEVPSQVEMSNQDLSSRMIEMSFAMYSNYDPDMADLRAEIELKKAQIKLEKKGRPGRLRAMSDVIRRRLKGFASSLRSDE
jgi:hypothetical protein